MYHEDSIISMDLIFCNFMAYTTELNGNRKFMYPGLKIRLKR